MLRPKPLHGTAFAYPDSLTRIPAATSFCLHRPLAFLILAYSSLAPRRLMQDDGIGPEDQHGLGSTKSPMPSTLYHDTVRSYIHRLI